MDPHDQTSTAGLRVVSANVRCRIDDRDPAHPDWWQRRLPVMGQLLAALRPAVVGVQEAHFSQLEGILAELPGFASVGFGRDGGSQGEYSALLYDTAALRLLGWQQFWLSETPETIASKSWGTGCTRVCTVARFALVGGHEVVVANTHLDNASELARHEGMRLLLSRLPDPRDVPLVLTGDFNCLAGLDPVWQQCVDAGLRDSFLVAERRGRVADTFHDYHQPFASEPLERIDWVMVSSQWRVAFAEVATDTVDGVWGSDHWPVVADLELA